jgi:AbrB family looped-hinge helix DNA binding protein
MPYLEESGMGNAVKTLPRLRARRVGRGSDSAVVVPSILPRPTHATVRITEGGRIVIPAEVRQRLGLEVGTELVMTVEGDQATLTSAEASRRRAQERVRRFIPGNVSLSEELMAERKREAERD